MRPIGYLHSLHQNSYARDFPRMRGSPAVDLRLGKQTVRLGERPLLMGIVNVTPDSFSDGGRFLDTEQAVAHAQRLVAEGADWLDIGGESTRPGADPVPLEEELRRVVPVLERLADSTGKRAQVPISIDTCKPQVARRAVELGVRIINDVTGFRDPAMIEAAAGCDAACVCMHMRGSPKTMQEHASYADVVGELLQYFEGRIETMVAGGIARDRIIVDPGIGFAKKRRHNLEILRRLEEFHQLGRPLLLGTSRKRIIGELTGRSEEARLSGSIAAAIVCCLRGVQILRVHDIGPVRDALAVVCAIETEQWNAE